MVFLSGSIVELCKQAPAIAVVLILAAACCAMGQSVVIRDAQGMVFGPYTDSNSPAHWDGDTLYILNSNDYPVRSFGPDQFHWGEPQDAKSNTPRPCWIEATWKTDDGALYGWYHHEPRPLCAGTDLSAPKIGAARSTDNGLNWTDLGIVLEAPAGTIDCSYANGFFAGGHGDFSGILDREGKYYYIFYSNYAGDVSRQGVAVARMAWKDRDNPRGKFRKYCQGKWLQPGIGGHSTPFFPTKISWKEEKVDSFWGPSIHWNTYLEKYVILLNRAVGGPEWPQEGIYITFGTDLADPKSWTEPKKIVDGDWYPQVLGLDTKAKETDKLCGRVGRLYMHGISRKEIVFLRDGDDPTKLPPVYRFRKPKTTSP